MNAVRPSVLVVDDSATSRAMLHKQLEQCGCQVSCAQDGTSALAVLAHTRFDLVLLDCYMPDMNGYEVAREIRAREGDGDLYTPIIGVSAEADAAHVQLCLDSGMDGILGKPLPLQEFKKMLVLWCDYAPHECAPAGACAVAEPAAHGVVDLEALFLDTSVQDLAQMRQAYGRGDIEAGKRMAHRMKGAALTMRREPIVELLERIEAASTVAADSAGRVDMAVIESAMDALQQALKC